MGRTDAPVRAQATGHTPTFTRRVTQVRKKVAVTAGSAMAAYADRVRASAPRPSGGASTNACQLFCITACESMVGVLEAGRVADMWMSDCAELNCWSHRPELKKSVDWWQTGDSYAIDGVPLLSMPAMPPY